MQRHHWPSLFLYVFGDCIIRIKGDKGIGTCGTVGITQVGVRKGKIVNRSDNKCVATSERSARSKSRDVWCLLYDVTGKCSKDALTCGLYGKFRKFRWKLFRFDVEYYGANFAMLSCETAKEKLESC